MKKIDKIHVRQKGLIIFTISKILLAIVLILVMIMRIIMKILGKHRGYL